jgi:hypothetical protein
MIPMVVKVWTKRQRDNDMSSYDAYAMRNKAQLGTGARI